MPKHISDYSEEALRRQLEEEFDVGGMDETIMVKRSDNEYISDYKRNDYDGGYTVISYSRCMDPSLHLKAGIMSFGLFLPFTLVADAVMRMGLGKHTHYFHTENGDELGTSKNEAIKRASVVGEQLMREGKYDAARSYFNIAFFLCNDSREEGFENRRNDAANNAAEQRKREEREERQRQERERQEREREEREREEREREKRLREIREWEERQRLIREREIRERKEREMQIRERQERKRQEREQEERERKAKAAYQSGQEIWSEAFILEIDHSPAEAKRKFEESNELFNKATTLMPHVTLYKNWFLISSLKLEGDRLFNEAVILQELGNLLRQRRNYVDALEKYHIALIKYKKGYNISKDSRFEACIEFVESCIREVGEIIEEMDLKDRLQHIHLESSRRSENTMQDNYRESKFCRQLDS